MNEIIPNDLCVYSKDMNEAPENNQICLVESSNVYSNLPITTLEIEQVSDFLPEHTFQSLQQILK